MSGPKWRRWPHATADDFCRFLARVDRRRGKEWNLTQHVPACSILPWPSTNECCTSKKTNHTRQSPRRRISWSVHPGPRKVGCQNKHELLETLYNWRLVNLFLQECLHSKSNFYYVNQILNNQLRKVEEPISLHIVKVKILIKALWRKKLPVLG